MHEWLPRLCQVQERLRPLQLSRPSVTATTGAASARAEAPHASRASCGTSDTSTLAQSLMSPPAPCSWRSSVWCILICHSHLTSIIICRTAVWAQACGSEHRTSFVIIVHLWSIRCAQSFVVAVGVSGGNGITILLFLVRIFWTFATVKIFVLCVLVNTLQYHDTVDIVQDSETEDRPAWDETVARRKN